MTTRELVVRMAAFFGGYPHEVWRWPFHYYLAVRAEYLKIHGAVKETKAEEVMPGVSVEHYNS